MDSFFIDFLITLHPSPELPQGHTTKVESIFIKVNNRYGGKSCINKSQIVHSEPSENVTR